MNKFIKNKAGTVTEVNTSKLRLKSFAIRGLFGLYSHDFYLDSFDRVTILHGPNGVGKTAVLRLLFSLFAGRTFQVFATMFDVLLLEFEGGERLEITRTPADTESKAEHMTVTRIDKMGLQQRYEAYVDNRILTKFASSIARRAPWLERIDDDLWMDRRSLERLTTGDLLSKFDGADPDLRLARIAIGENIRPLLHVHLTLQEFSKRVDVHFIETQRLLSKSRKIDRTSYSEAEDADAEVRTTVTECAEELKQRISHSLSGYARESQRRDQSFPMRLLNLGPHDVDRIGLNDRLRFIAAKRTQLAEVGLLIEKTDPSAMSLDRLDLTYADQAQLRVIELFAEDTAGKLETLDDVLNVASLFFGVVNARFRHKQLALDFEKGLVATSETQNFIKLEALSSGEQHQLVLFFDLIFRVAPGSIVLIDEPELSLHVAWQKTILNSLIEIARVNSLDIVVATHSPYIVGDRYDLMRDLTSPDDPHELF